MFSRGFFVYLYYTLTVSDESKLKTFKPINDFGGRIPIDLIGFLFNYSIMNKPYVKKFDEKGNVTNPIDSVYKSPYPNRSQRRMRIKENEIDPKATRVQHEWDTNGKYKLINHYD